MLTENANELVMQAWLAGPGWRGAREPLDSGARAALIENFEAAELPVPPYLESPTEWVDRPAKLFEAGDYPDKGLTVSPADLVKLAESMEAPVPILIEHAESPLEIGYLTDIRAEGDELLGTVALTQEANALIEQSGAKSLSLGLLADLSGIKEVSLVSDPRVPDAQIFRRSGFIEANQVKARVDQLIAEGKLIPAQRAVAEVLLGFSGPLTFNGASAPVGRLVEQLLQSGKPNTLFQQQAPVAHADAEDALLLPEEAEFYRRHFPGVDLHAIAAKRTLRAI